jgi:hypothetical protein
MANLAVTYRQQGRAKEAEELEARYRRVELDYSGPSGKRAAAPVERELKETCGACGQRLRNSL